MARTKPSARRQLEERLDLRQPRTEQTAGLAKRQKRTASGDEESGGVGDTASDEGMLSGPSLTLIDLILSNSSLTPLDLRRCSLVSRSFLAVARSRLFSRLTFTIRRDDHYVEGSVLGKGTRRLFRVLQTSPHLAQLVKSIKVRVQEYEYDRDGPPGNIWKVLIDEERFLEELIVLLPALNKVELENDTDGGDLGDSEGFKERCEERKIEVSDGRDDGLDLFANIRVIVT
ncbi:hypothetical protein JCM1840_005888 [Sporobolomyces johnsonii]